MTMSMVRIVFFPSQKRAIATFRKTSRACARPERVANPISIEQSNA